MFSSVVPVHTDIGMVQSIIEWPCVYVDIDDVGFRIDLSLSLDTCVGYVDSKDDNVELYLPDEMTTDDICVEICCLWIILLKLQCSDCAVQVNCLRKSTWLCLKKKRHPSNMLASVLRLIFWWSMFFNVKLVFIYDQSSRSEGSP